MQAAPAPAERARAIVARCGPAIVATDSCDVAVEPLHLPASPRRAQTDGSISLQVDLDHTVIALLAAAPRARLDVVVEFTDPAPVPLREPNRGLLWVGGVLELLNPAEARAAAISIAQTTPDVRLLDVGYDATVLSLQPAFFSLADGDGNHGIEAAAFTAARADPLARWEQEWLAHLDTAHPDVLAALARHLPRTLRPGRLRPVGVDRFGLRLRIETATTSHDFRLPFDRTALTPPEVTAEVHRLASCPHLLHDRH